MAAFEELVYRYEGRICRFAANACRNQSDAADITQDTFVKAFQAIGQFNVHQSFRTWLFTIARRKCIDRFRAARHAATEPVPELADDHLDPAELLSQREDRQRLWAVARRRLPEAQFQALWLKYAEGMDVAQVARVLRKTKTHVKVLLFRGRRALARELDASGVARQRPCSDSGAGALATGKKPGDEPAVISPGPYPWNSAPSETLL
jgi:RNA polymerase sigma-70 factor (ECF subfamily)